MSDVLQLRSIVLAHKWSPKQFESCKNSRGSMCSWYAVLTVTVVDVIANFRRALYRSDIMASAWVTIAKLKLTSYIIKSIETDKCGCISPMQRPMYCGLQFVSYRVWNTMALYDLWMPFEVLYVVTITVLKFVLHECHAGCLIPNPSQLELLQVTCILAHAADLKPQFFHKSVNTCKNHKCSQVLNTYRPLVHNIHKVYA